ncbi:nucleotidyl transferase AbiEii/AbiGii toxin family protein [Polynucleobacter kasalickyi]|uniref:Nucleotidyl transferase AbiEii toxin, Type IV TA system n=1 Tax=Polynucleobacter kasalickyi TaxID=1938817 RepID=A0A1W2CB86_9BURK|nr:nucleotidyl transferase AbiEii/AbiGii toxin family protein [Polynucleobacter kasalickyi]SMC82366.1 Nucleotidyl transferase AbiEii toxin, Type IV TA system [Polynucleobacter kasalickyi]
MYPRYTVVAEKLDAIISLGIANSRLKDYFDLWVILHHSDLDKETLRKAVEATTSRRKTIMPSGLPMGLTSEFSQDKTKIFNGMCS